MQIGIFVAQSPRCRLTVYHHYRGFRSGAAGYCQVVYY